MLTPNEIKIVLEAALLATQEPLPVSELRKMFDDEVDADTVRLLLEELRQAWTDRGVELVSTASGWRFQTKASLQRFLERIHPERAPRYSRAVLETLAIIAYKQPVTAPEISEIRGVNTSGVISTLLDKKLITTAGRKEVIGRPILYKTSKEFLMRFGLSDLDELPSLKEFEALAREALGSDEVVAADISEDQVSELHPETDIANAEPVAQGGSASPAASPSFSQTRQPERSEGSLLGRSDSAVDSAIHNAIDRAEHELASAEAEREHEALATDEGMPSGELDEDPPAPNAKSTAASD